jgi:hypothetical protein
MAAKLRWIGHFIFEVRGLDTDIAPKAYWHATVVEMAEALQERIAETFEGERTARGPLRPFGKQWARYKASHGLDPRKGHATGALQDALYDSSGRLFEVRRVSARKGTVAYRVYFKPAWLHSRVGYATFYEQAKVRGQGILQLAKSWINEVRPILVAAETAAHTARSRNIRSTAGVASLRGRGASFREFQIGRAMRRIG